MNGKKMWIVFGVATLTLCLSCNSMANERKERNAIKAAKAWLALIDEGRYGKSWETAAAYVRNVVPKGRWKQMLKAAREPLGRVISRRLKAKTYRRTLPGAPDGEYVVIQFVTSFENKKLAIETVTPMLDKDGKWRVSGYYIK